MNAAPRARHDLTATERADLDRDGFIVRHDVFDADEVADMRTQCEALVARLVRGRRAQRFRACVYTFDTDLENLTRIKWEGDTDVVHGIEPLAHLSDPLRRWAYDARLTQPMTAFVAHPEPELYTEKLNL